MTTGDLMILSNPAFPENPCFGNSSARCSWCDERMGRAAGDLPAIRATFLPSMKFIQRRASAISGEVSLAWIRRLAIVISRIGDVLSSRAAKERL